MDTTKDTSQDKSNQDQIVRALDTLYVRIEVCRTKARLHELMLEAVKFDDIVCTDGQRAMLHDVFSMIGRRVTDFTKSGQW